MTSWTSLIIYIINTLATLYVVFVILRFLLQMARADFYNPFSQAVVKVTNPLLLPLRKIIPGLWGIDFASLVLAMLLHLIVSLLLSMLAYGAIPNLISVLLWDMLGIIKLCTQIVWVGLIVLVITSFIAPHSSHPALMLVRQLMEPILRPVQRIIPPMGGLDFSVLFVFLGVNVLQQILDIVAYKLQLVPTIVLGY